MDIVCQAIVNACAGRIVNMNLYGKCPKCGSDWDGGLIPKIIRRHYGPPYKWSKAICIEYPEIYDGAAWYKCPDCKWGFPAIPGVEGKQFGGFRK